MTLYADDPDVHVRYQLTDSADGGLNDFTPTVTTSAGVTLTTTWEDVPAADRVLAISLYTDDGNGANQLAPGSHDLRLNVPGGNDVYLGREYLH